MLAKRQVFLRKRSALSFDCDDYVRAHPRTGRAARALLRRDARDRVIALGVNSLFVQRQDLDRAGVNT